MTIKNLRKLFPIRTSFIQSLIFKEKSFVHAVDGVTFQIKQGEVLGLVGESGCGKTTIGRLLAILETPTKGNIMFKNIDTVHLEDMKLKSFRKNVQMIFQDPYESLNPRRNVYNTIAEPLIIHQMGSPKERQEMVYDMLEQVELKPPEDFASRYPYELSGGQRQRVAIARAMILQPEFVVADEPVSMLDVSLRVGILNLMFKLKKEFDMTYLLITHDISVARYVSDRIATMYLGKIVELGPVENVIQEPKHPYTRLLMSAVPVPDPTYKRQRVQVSGELPSPIDLPKGCRFHPRCTHTMDICKVTEPQITAIEHDHFAACHLFN